MAYQLVVEVLDHAPPMTPAERLVLAAIAERMPRRTEWSIESRHLIRRTCLDARGLRAALARLAKRDLDVRVPIGIDRRGRPLYAKQGQAPKYRLPPFPPPAGCKCENCEASEGGTTVPPANGGGTRTSPAGTKTSPGDAQMSPGGTTGSAAGTTVPPTPSVPPDGDGVGADAATLRAASAAHAQPPDDRSPSVKQQLAALRASLPKGTSFSRYPKRTDDAPVSSAVVARMAQTSTEEVADAPPPT